MAAAPPKKGAAEARAAMAELVAELDRTRKEFAKATLQLTHLETTVQHLKDAEMKKDQVIAHLESELARREAGFSEELAIIQEEARSKEAALTHRTKFLQMEVDRLKQEVAVANTYEKENRQLRDAVLEGQATIEKLQVLNEELRSRAKEDAKDHATQLEAEFKRRLAESEKRFRAEAYRALSEEAKIALQGNDHLQTVLQRQNDSIEAVLLKCKHLEQAHAKIAGDQEISAQNLQHHVAEIQRLKKQLVDSRSRNTQLEDTLRQRKVERASLELLYVEYENGRKQLAKEKERGRRAAREAERWRNRAVQLTHELTGDQREAAEAKLLAVSTHNAAMEAHAAKARGREERAARIAERQAAGAQMLRRAGGATPEPGDFDDFDDEDDRWSRVSDEAAGAGDAIDDDVLTGAKGPTVNPMEILAMWNANFESYVPPGTTGSADRRLTSAGTTGAANLDDLMADEAPPSQLASPAKLLDRPDRETADPDPETTPRGAAAPGLPKALPLGAPLPGASAGASGVLGGSTTSTPRVSGGGVSDPQQQRATGAHSAGGPGGAGAAAAARLGPVRPPPKKPSALDDTRRERDAKLSVLAQPKQPNLPAPARSYAVQQATILNRKQQQSAAAAASSIPSGANLTVVSHGVVVQRPVGGSGSNAARFITP